MRILARLMLCCSAWTLSCLLVPVLSLAAHGQSIDGKLKYPKDFHHFDYVNPQAKIGGHLKLHELGGFDKMNPFTLKGVAAAGLGGYIFETLTVSSLDEPFAQYGLIARDMELAPDKKSVTFTLDQRAKFSDGSPITVEDVRFSLETLKSEQAHPSYQVYFRDIAGAEILDKERIRFYFARPNRELHMIAGQLPVLSKAFYSKHPFQADSGKEALAVPLGSGPYLVKEIVPGKMISYQKNPNYWAKDHPSRRGMFNVEQVSFHYYKDPVVSVEAFKAGEFDLLNVHIAKQWHRDLQGRRFDSGELRKEALAHHNNAGMQAFVFNTRKPLFADARVRRALGLAFDFEWTNDSLFFSEYQRCNSFFSNSIYAASGLPNQEELALLTPLKEQIPAEVFTQALTPPSTKPPASLRGNMQEALRLLAQSGWTMQGGQLKNSLGQPFAFDILLADTAFERVVAPFANNLKKIGIAVEYRTIDLALYTDRIKNFDFDMVVTTFGQSQSPGNEQRDYWTSEAAKRPGSRNLAGISNSAIDALVDAVIYADTQDKLITACRALDRVLWHGYYVIPNWYLPKHRLAYAANLRRPAQLPLYYSVDQWLDAWWMDANKE